MSINPYRLMNYGSSPKWEIVQAAIIAKDHGWRRITRLVKRRKRKVYVCKYLYPDEFFCTSLAQVIFNCMKHPEWQWQHLGKLHRTPRHGRMLK